MSYPKRVVDVRFVVADDYPTEKFIRDMVYNQEGIVLGAVELVNDGFGRLLAKQGDIVMGLEDVDENSPTVRIMLKGGE